MKYPALKDAADAERKKQKLVDKILDIKTNTHSQTVLLSMDIKALEKLIQKSKPKKSDS
ncbi:hypothetical protein KAR91_13000 [Candidatus Pacearchaeota archaeon]|nr:hypothetical protein [Candidatus Pacearchaeota archaeon]